VELEGAVERVEVVELPNGDRVRFRGEVRRGRRRSIVAVAVAGAAIAMLGSGSTPAAEAPSRAEYVTRLEAICRPDVKATERVMDNVRQDVRRERLEVAAGKFDEAERIFSGTVNEMAQAPRPPADVTKLDKWFGLLRREESWLRRIAAALRHDEKIEAQRYTAHFIHSGNLANNSVIAFGFDYCNFRFSRFG
jgi:hypothetical protein